MYLDLETTSAGGDQFVHRFYIVAPSLGNYRYKLFEICHRGEIPHGMRGVAACGQATRANTGSQRAVSRATPGSARSHRFTGEDSYDVAIVAPAEPPSQKRHCQPEVKSATVKLEEWPSG